VPKTKCQLNVRTEVGHIDECDIDMLILRLSRFMGLLACRYGGVQWLWLLRVKNLCGVGLAPVDGDWSGVSVRGDNAVESGDSYRFVVQTT
jgi:hypothetical protein